MVEDKLHKAMSRLITRRPFYGAIALRLELVEDNSQPTAYTDAKVIGYNSHFIEQLTPEQTQFVLCHEVLHVVLKHPWRREGREHGLFNEACDYVINLIAKDDNFSLLSNILYDEKYRGMSSEQVYTYLLRNKKEEDDQDSSGSSSQESNGDGSSGKPNSNGEYDADNVPSFEEAVQSGQFGEVRDCVGDDGKSDDAVEAEWETAITTAGAQARKRGTMPGSVIEAIFGRNESHVDWHEALINFLSDAGNNFEVTWAKPNRRFIDGGDYFPSMKREGVNDLVIAVDTSGSVSKREIVQFCSETLEIAEQFDCDITFIPCDSEIGTVQHFTSGDYPTEVDGFEIGGRCGTSFKPPFKWVEDNRDELPTAMIYFTDGECSYPDEPTYPVLWGISRDLSRRYSGAPWGESIEVVV